VPHAKKNELAVGNTSRRWKKPSLHQAHLIAVGSDRDDKWAGWVRLLILVGAPPVLWGVIVLAWVLFVS
jgi:hypothetical protein